MMRLLIILGIAVSCLYSAAQSADSLQVAKKKKIDHEVFINTTFFIKQIISLSNSNLEISPYIIGYKVFPGKHHGLRFSIGGNWNYNRQKPDSTFVQIRKSNSVDYRVGYEYRHGFGKRWAFFGGVDFINGFSGSSNRVNSNTDILTTQDKSFTVGGGPVIGIQLNISKRIFVFTETAFYYSYEQTLSKVNSLNFTELNSDQVTEVSQKATFLLPTSIFFVFRF
jgi:hypothetical protein